MQIKARNVVLNGVHDNVNSSQKKIAKLEDEKYTFVEFGCRCHIFVVVVVVVVVTAGSFPELGFA